MSPAKKKPTRTRARRATPVIALAVRRYIGQIERAEWTGPVITVTDGWGEDYSVLRADGERALADIVPTYDLEDAINRTVGNLSAATAEEVAALGARLDNLDALPAGDRYDDDERVELTPIGGSYTERFTIERLRDAIAEADQEAPVYILQLPRLGDYPRPTLNATDGLLSIGCQSHTLADWADETIVGRFSPDNLPHPLADLATAEGRAPVLDVLRRKLAEQQAKTRRAVARKKAASKRRVTKRARRRR